VFDHSVKVMRNFEEIMSFEFLPSESRRQAIEYFQTKIAGISRHDQLKAMIFLHDIAKPLVFKVNEDGTAGASSLHEALAAALVVDFQQRLEISDEVVARIRQMVLLHGTISEIINISLEKKDHDSFLKLFEKLTTGYTTDLLCFILADIKGSDLDVSMPPAFQERISLLTTWIDREVSFK
jgi:hypothetical protein